MQQEKKVYGCKHASRLLLEEFMFIFLLDFTVGQNPDERVRGNTLSLMNSKCLWKNMSLVKI